MNWKQTFTRGIKNRFTRNFTLYRFVTDIRNRFRSNSTFHKFTAEITDRFPGKSKSDEIIRDNRFTGYKRIATLWTIEDWILPLETSDATPLNKKHIYSKSTVITLINDAS